MAPPLSADFRVLSTFAGEHATAFAIWYFTRFVSRQPRRNVMGSSWSRPRCSRTALALGLVAVLAGCSISAASVLNTAPSSAKASSSRLAVGSVTLTTVSFTWNWVEQRPKTSPSARDSYAMAYDAATKQLILFGGEVPSGITAFDDTWLWTGKTWQKLLPKVSPPAGLMGAAMAYDASTRQLIMFGGNTNLGEHESTTWAWTGASWKKLKPKTSPPALSYAACAYDAKSKQVIIFGGNANRSPGTQQTWDWTGTTWKRLSPKESPPAADDGSMTYDQSTGILVLFGGFGKTSGTPSSETWTWSGENWTLKSPKPTPPARGGAAIAFDDSTNQLLMFGGIGKGDGGTQSLGDTWEWSESGWFVPRPPNHPSGRFTSMTFDASTKQLVLFGGGSLSSDKDFNDTWL
jgi:hypothetical protein